MQKRAGHGLIQGAISSVGGQIVRTHSASQKKMDEYTRYEAGLDKLHEHISKGSIYYFELLGYEQRLRENIEKARRYGDPPARQAERTEVIDRLNGLAIAALEIDFNRLCDLNEKQAQKLRVYEEEVGTTDPEPLSSFQLSDLNITEKFADNVAILHVYSYGAEHFSMILGNARLEELHTDPIKRPGFSLSQLDLDTQDASTTSVLDDVEGYLIQASKSPSFRTVLKSLSRLRRIFLENVYLVIADFTNFEVPWEMLKLPPIFDAPEVEAGYLGALVTVTRWQSCIDDEYEDVFLSIDAEECTGNIITYTSEEEDIDTEKGILNKLNAVSHRNIKDFQSHLRKNEPGYGMIYVSCQGFFSEDFYHVAIGSNTNDQQRLFLKELYKFDELGLLRSSRSIVFINASHSGRLYLDSQYSCDERLLGFAELFLSKGARGVIGTLGAVSRKYAAEIGSMLLEEIAHSSQQPVATLLRNVRARIVKNLHDKPFKELSDPQRLISAFRYVYYGNPLAVLRFSKQEGASDV